MKRLLLILFPILLGVLVWWGYRTRNRPPEAPFTRVLRETLVSTLPTNGKVEPIEWSAVRAGDAGMVSTVPVQEGQTVAKGAVLATLADAGLAAELAAGEARVTQARAELATVESGGRGTELAAIEGDLAKARFERDAAQREYASLRRLAEKQAATPVEVQAARQKVEETELQIQALERRRASLVGKADRGVAEARLRDAQAAVAGVRARMAATVIRAPLAGVVYALAVRPGAYLNPGDAVASVGRIDRLRVRVYVDEPELGRVEAGQPVTITWDALPGRKWDGTVERKPTEIRAEGTRQIGEVLCTIENPHRELIPGTNVNAEIRTSVVKNALTIPKEALRREPGGVGVYVLRGDVLAWQPVVTGASSVTRLQVVRGLADGDSVALPTDTPLKAGLRVRAVYP